MSSIVNLKIDGQKICLDKRVVHVQGTQGFYKIKLNYDAEEWVEIVSKVIVFAYTEDYERRTNPKTVKMAVEPEDDLVTIPNQFLRKTGIIEVGVIGYSEDGDIKVTTTALEPGSNKIRVVEAITDTTTVSPLPDTPDIWVTLKNQIGDLSKLETTTKANLVAAINEVLNAESGITREEVEEIANAAVASEASEREDADEALQANIDAAVVAVNNSIQSEAETREAADTALSDRITAETTTRETADATLSAAITAETTNREEADQDLQAQIDGITASSDVKDIVGTKAELDDYDTATLGNNDIIKVLQDESEDDATTYYRWNATASEFTLIGEEGPYYTKAQADGEFVPYTRTVNGKSLSANIALDAGDVSAVATSDVVQTTGNGVDKVMSQAATTTALNGKQDTLVAGNNITISGDTISATDTTYSAFTGTDGTAAGAAGLVPAPATTDADKFLKSDGTWEKAGGTLYNGLGLNTDGAMTQKAITDTFFASDASATKIKIGNNSVNNAIQGVVIGENASVTNYRSSVAVGPNAKSYGANGAAFGPVAVAPSEGVAIGYSAGIIGSSTAGTYAKGAIAIGAGAKIVGAENANDRNGSIAMGASSEVRRRDSVALGHYAVATRIGEVNVGAGSTANGYNNTSYRLISGVHDGVDPHDAATVGQLPSTVLDITDDTTIDDDTNYTLTGAQLKMILDKLNM